MVKITPSSRLIAAFSRIRCAWLEWELRAIDHDINATAAEIADYEFCGQPATAAGLRTYLQQRNFQAACLRAEINQLKESLQ